MTDNEIIKAWECCLRGSCCEECPMESESYCINGLYRKTLDLINRQKAEIERLEHLLLGVMHFVDKWLDGAELKQDEVNRARAMREKTLQIVEKLEEENDFLKSIDIDRIKAEAVKEFAEKFKKIAVCGKTSVFRFPYYQISKESFDNLVKEMVGEG